MSLTTFITSWCQEYSERLELMISKSISEDGFFLPLRINNYTLQSFQSSHFPFLLQRACACLERHWSSALWKLVQLILQQADLGLNLPSRCSLQFICLYLHWGGMNHTEKGAIPLLTFNSHPVVLHKMHTYSYSRHSTVVKKHSDHLLTASRSIGTMILTNLIIIIILAFKIKIFRRPMFTSVDANNIRKQLPRFSGCLVLIYVLYDTVIIVCHCSSLQLYSVFQHLSAWLVFLPTNVLFWVTFTTLISITF